CWVRAFAAGIAGVGTCDAVGMRLGRDSDQATAIIEIEDPVAIRVTLDRRAGRGARGDLAPVAACPERALAAAVGARDQVIEDLSRRRNVRVVRQGSGRPGFEADVVVRQDARAELAA